jgi:TPR repeat protein
VSRGRAHPGEDRILTTTGSALLAGLLVITLAGCASVTPRSAAGTPGAPVAPAPGAATPEGTVAGAPPAAEAPASAAAPPPSVPPGSSPDRAARSHLDAGRALIARGETVRAIASFRKALRLEPDLVEARTALGIALQRSGNVDGAIDELRAVLGQHPDALEARAALAATLIARRDWTAARAELDEMLRRQPGSLEAAYGLGTVRYALGDVGGAIAAYRRVLADEPEHPDAHYDLALMLKVAGRDAEATAEFVEAARGGVAKAQYFAGAAYAGGVGVERDLPAAIAWWLSAAEQGVAPADEALAQLRRTALGRGRHAAAEREAAEQAFRDFRAGLWSAFPALTPGADESVGAALLRSGRAAEAVPVLIREALALSEPAERLLESVYETGVDGVAAHDPRILRYLDAAAAEGEVRPRLALARIYAEGLGVPQDVDRAIALLKATPHEDAQRLLRELSATGSAPPARP